MKNEEELNKANLSQIELIAHYVKTRPTIALLYQMIRNDIENFYLTGNQFVPNAEHIVDFIVRDVIKDESTKNEIARIYSTALLEGAGVLESLKINSSNSRIEEAHEKVKTIIYMLLIRILTFKGEKLEDKADWQECILKIT